VTLAYGDVIPDPISIETLEMFRAGILAAFGASGAPDLDRCEYVIQGLCLRRSRVLDRPDGLTLADERLAQAGEYLMQSGGWDQASGGGCLTDTYAEWDAHLQELLAAQSEG
jgi:hypothetical protein